MLGSDFLRTVPLATVPMLALWNDAAWLRAACDFEAALAEAQAALGLIAHAHAATIADVARDFIASPADLAEKAAHAGTLAIPLIAALREAVAARDPAAAASVHTGATSQDVADTVMMLQARAAQHLVLHDLARLDTALAAHAAAHAETPMTGRTLLQPALPITFGLKCAQWLLATRDAAARLRAEADRALRLQLGGAAGTLAGFGGQGEPLCHSVAARLGLKAAALPWHARRGNVAGLAAALAIAAGETAKMARDIALLAQAEVGEAREPASPGRGGSSAMTHKRNQTLCQRALTAALRTPHLAATLLIALPQELERGLGGWQADGAILADLFCATHAAIAAMAETAEGLHIDHTAMARNLAAAAIGTDPAEAARLTHTALAFGH